MGRRLIRHTLDLPTFMINRQCRSNIFNKKKPPTTTSLKPLVRIEMVDFFPPIRQFQFLPPITQFHKSLVTHFGTLRDKNILEGDIESSETVLLVIGNNTDGQPIIFCSKVPWRINAYKIADMFFEKTGHRIAILRTVRFTCVNRTEGMVYEAGFY